MIFLLFRINEDFLEFNFITSIFNIGVFNYENLKSVRLWIKLFYHIQDVISSGSRFCSFFWSCFWYIEYCGLFIRADLVQKCTSRARNSTCLKLKCINFLEAEWITSGPESGRGYGLKAGSESEMMEIQVIVTDAKLQGQIEKLQI